MCAVATRAILARGFKHHPRCIPCLGSADTGHRALSCRWAVFCPDSPPRSAEGACGIPAICGGYHTSFQNSGPRAGLEPRAWGEIRSPRRLVRQPPATKRSYHAPSGHPSRLERFRSPPRREAPKARAAYPPLVAALVTTPSSRRFAACTTTMTGRLCSPPRPQNAGGVCGVMESPHHQTSCRLIAFFCTPAWQVDHER